MDNKTDIRKQSNKEDILPRQKYIILSIIALIFIISALAFSWLNYVPKPDMVNEKIIRDAAAISLLLNSDINKKPEDFADEDFATIKEFKIPALNTNPVFYTELSDIKLLEKFIKLEVLSYKTVNVANTYTTSEIDSKHVVSRH